MKSPKKKYCSFCGSELVSQTMRDAYDTETGLPLLDNVCLKYGCPRNEICRGLHSYGFTGRCKKCGQNLGAF